MRSNQTSLIFNKMPQKLPGMNRSNRERLIELLGSDLDFRGETTAYISHNFHSFPAKFPQQLPRTFINGLSQPGDTILDPMNGSGTTVVEAYLSGRHGIGFDIDPLALKIARVKIRPLEAAKVINMGNQIISRAMRDVEVNQKELDNELAQRWDTKTKEFVDYWFAPVTRRELIALLRPIEAIDEKNLRAFFELTFSSIIITKSGGVSLALDLAHTRPHKAKIVTDKQGNIVFNNGSAHIPEKRRRFQTKILRSAIAEFNKKFQFNLKGLIESGKNRIPADIRAGNSQNLPLDNDSVDLIITSPPYASNAIDYMRAHKFSLVWFNHPIDGLSQKRRRYIGGETTIDVNFEKLPEFTNEIISKVTAEDRKKGKALRRYYSEMTRSLREMQRVLKPGKAAIVVVGTSILRGIDIRIDKCLTEIGGQVGFSVPAVGTRQLDRNKRMMPAGHTINFKSQIQQRMHSEFVVGFYKPD